MDLYWNILNSVSIEYIDTYIIKPSGIFCTMTTWEEIIILVYLCFVKAFVVEFKAKKVYFDIRKILIFIEY